MRLGRVASLPLQLPLREWTPGALVCALVLIGGARLIVLSTQQRIAENHAATADAAERTASSIEAELEALAERAGREAARAANVSGIPEGSESIAPEEDVFRTANDGSIIPAAYASEDAAAREALAREWRAGDGHSEGTGIEWLAPVRQGSQWLVAARAPILMANRNDVEHSGWAVAYQSLEEMLLRTGIAELPQQGYEFAVAQPTPGRDALRPLMGSPFVASLDHITGTIRLPDASRGAGTSPPYMVLALRPRAGWYSVALLTANIGVLLLVTCVLGLAAYNLTHSQLRWRAALALARRRLVATNRRLTEELEDRRRLQLTFEHARFHDTFTGLPNRRYFMQRLDRALHDRGGRGQQLAVILLDIDRFRLVNDTLGQTAGDELMVQVARRFENKIGTDSGHVLARWSGDQFAVLLLDVHSRDTAVTFAKLLGDALARPFVLRRHTLSVAAHTGITCVDTELQRTEDVVREADVALSVAKRREARDPVVYQAALGADVVSTVSLEADLHVALEREQFRLLFQPIVDLAAGTVVGAEALLRWHHPVEGLLAPDRFLSIAEDARLIVPISRWVIRRACRLGAEWRGLAQTDNGFYVSVNLAATVLDDPLLVQYVADVLRDTGLPAGFLRFELTEGDLTPHVGAAREVLDALHDMGIRLVLDDFGTGRSSLSYLELFPIDCVKIDRPFVNPADGSDSDVMRSVVHMASSLGLEAVAEKVETETALGALKRMGCKYGQGYLLGEPVEWERLLASLTGRTLTPAPADAPTLVQPALAEPVAADAPTLVLRRRPGTAAADDPTIERPRASDPAAPEAPTLNQPGLAAVPADAEARVAPPTPAAPDTPTLVLPRRPERHAPDAPTIVLRERPGAAAADDPTIERPGAWDPAAADAPTVSAAGPAAVADAETRGAPSSPEGAAPDAPTVEQPVAVPGDEARDADDPTARIDAPLEAADEDSATQPRLPRRWLKHRRGT
jgi:diguanylate cyclase (GGDEF)-like protein